MTNVTMAFTASVSPILFVTFHETYNISYSLLGFLAVIGFGIQLVIDLVFSFFSKYFNIAKIVRLMPLICFFGMMIYSIMPALFPNAAYFWILLGTFVFSVSAGLCEVLISPLIAAIPSENPDREMSKLHSTYAWGVVGVVILSTLLLKIVGNEKWYFMTALWCILPLITFGLFLKSKMPEMNIFSSSEKRVFPKGIFLCVMCIFLGGASECTMTQWCSGFLEKAAGIPKAYGDIFGLAFFALFLGLGRTLYSKYGKNILRTLTICMSGTVVCYLIATISNNPTISLIGCVLTGFSTSMLWPGTLILMEEKYQYVSVGAYALMAAGGDAGGAIGPQLVGIVVDLVMESNWSGNIAAKFLLSAEQFAMKTGLLVATLFPICGVILLAYMMKFYKGKKMVTR